MGNYSEEACKGKQHVLTEICLDWQHYLVVLMGIEAYTYDHWLLSAIFANPSRNRLISLENDWTCTYLASSSLRSLNLFLMLNVVLQMATWTATTEKVKINTCLLLKLPVLDVHKIIPTNVNARDQPQDATSGNVLEVASIYSFVMAKNGHSLPRKRNRPFLLCGPTVASILSDKLGIYNATTDISTSLCVF